MIYGIGIDQIEVARVARNVDDEMFLRKVYSPSEISYCNDRGIPAQHFAARFAAKEAMLKALGLGLDAGFDLSDIYVLPDENGKPILELAGAISQHVESIGIRKIHVSLSHLKEVASAIVILEK